MASCHGFISTGNKLNFYNKIDQGCLRLSNRVVCVSESIKDSLVKAGVDRKKVRVIPNAVPVDLDGLKSKSKERLQEGNYKLRMINLWLVILAG